jgi:ParB family chromosome partitioning protein
MGSLRKRWCDVAKHSGLGRGLESLLGETAGEVSETEPSQAEIPLDEIQVNPNQPRKHFDEESLDELSDSIRQNGLIQPILVRRRGDHYEIVAGERRYQASKRAGLVTVPVVVKDVSNEDMLKIALIENLQREDLNPIETAMGYRRLIQENGLRQQDLAELLSRSRSSITNSLRLLELPEVVQELLRDGKLTPGHARAILSVDGEDNRVKLAEKVVREGLSVRQTEKLASWISVQTDAAQKEVGHKGARPAAFGAAERKLHDALKLPVAVRQVRGKNKLEIQFEDEGQLSALISLLTSEEASSEADEFE